MFECELMAPSLKVKGAMLADLHAHPNPPTLQVSGFRVFYPPNPLIKGGLATFTSMALGPSRVTPASVTSMGESLGLGFGFALALRGSR